VSLVLRSDRRTKREKVKPGTRLHRTLSERLKKGFGFSCNLNSLEAYEPGEDMIWPNLDNEIDPA
jgi:hypothetical protein